MMVFYFCGNISLFFLVVVCFFSFCAVCVCFRLGILFDYDRYPEGDHIPKRMTSCQNIDEQGNAVETRDCFSWIKLHVSFPIPHGFTQLSIAVAWNATTQL